MGEEHTTYLSRSEGRFRVIHQGIPIAPDKATKGEALADATRAGLTVAPRVWDGTLGAFVDDHGTAAQGWGLPPAEGARYHWSARAIYPVDLLWDRMAVEGEASEDERRALGRWLDDKALPYLRSLAANGSTLPLQSDNQEIRVSGDGYTLRANPRASYGYLYMSAAPDPSATGPTPKARKPRAPRDAQRSRLARRRPTGNRNTW